MDAGSRLAWRMAIVGASILAAAGVLLQGSGSNARVALDHAMALVGQGKPPTDPAVRSLVRRALGRDLTQQAAIELTALADEGRGDRVAAARLYHLSDRISRRSLATRLWLVQDAVARGDVAATLAHMDLALRTSSAAPGFIFPALARGLEDPGLIGPIAALVDRPSDWREEFLAYAAENADPSSAAGLFLRLRNRQVIARDELDRKLIVRLAAAAQFARARELDAAFNPHPPGAGGVADGHFVDLKARYPFGWGLTVSGELEATREIEAGHAVLAYRADAAEGGQVAAQLLTLPPGSYVLATQAGPSQASDASPQWVLSCAAPSRLVVSLALPSAGHASASVPFSIGSDCRAQWLVLTIRPALAPQSGSVEEVTIASR